MSKKERDLRLHIMITHEELAAIQERMAEVNSQNQSAFIRKMAVDGYVVNVDLAPVKELLSLQRRSVNNLFQIAKYAKAHNAYQFELWNFNKATPNYGNSIQSSWNTLQNWLHFRTSGQVGPKSNKE